MSSHDNAGPIERCIGLSESGNHSVAAPLRGPKVDEEYLVFGVIDDARQVRPATCQVRRGELALEDRILQVIAVTAHGLEDLAEALVIADIVTDQVRSPHLRAVPSRG
jgi:hypothetical protein